MSTPNDGGPAFPAPPVSLKNRDGSEWTVFGGQGMTLRDYFAAKAMAAQIGCPDYVKACALNGKSLTEIYQQFAQESYKAADAMLKARENKE